MLETYTTEQLNEQQQKAVETTEGPLLVLAGAGTGKTKVLTSRIAYILNQGFAPAEEILAVTFTNKASKEMQHRINLQRAEGGGFVNAGTFHSIAAKILRQYAASIGLNSNFNIIDQDDSLKVIKSIYEEIGEDKKDINPKIVHNIISRWKDSGIYYDQLSNSDLKSKPHYLAKKIYPIYQNKIFSSNLCDFGDLLLYNVRLFFAAPEILERLQERFKYLLIDEYQDTNGVQYLWARMLADKYRNICCVGDDDQSIYSWRGAEVENILRFEKDFPNAKIIALEQNYRSTPHILSVASALIKNNPVRHNKTLWTNTKEGEKIKIISCYNEKEEAKFVANYVMKILHSSIEKASEIAILVRAGFQTRNFEEAFISSGIQYKVIGGPRFYERAEIKDIVAYLRIMINKNDDVAFERIINVPRRSVGASTIKKIKNYALDNQTSLFDSLHNMKEEGFFKTKTLIEVENFINLIIKWRSKISQPHSPADLLKDILKESGYKDMLKKEDSEEAKNRLDNLNELIRAVSEYDSIQEFIEHTSLVSEGDMVENTENMISIMTLHAAKGLEFNMVFMPGMEEGLFPNQKSLNEEGISGLEEERRIAYVGITRAKKSLIMLYAESRRIFNEFVVSIPSRFLNELPADSIEKSSSTGFFSFINSKKRKTFNSYNNLLQTNASSGKFHNKTLTTKKTINIDESDSLQSNTIRPGATVMHKSFGRGIVLKKSSDNLEIIFDNQGIKTIKEGFIELIN